MSAGMIGLIAGALCFWMVTVAKSRFSYDDSLDAFGVHGAGGTMAAFLEILLRMSFIGCLRMPMEKGMPLGLIEGNGHPIVNQETST